MTRSSAGIRPVTPVVVVGIATLALAGCQSGESSSGPAGASPSARTSQPSATSSAPTPHQPADGTNLSSCKDNTCEVKVTGPGRIPVNEKSGVTSLRVRSIGPDAISLTAIAASKPTGYQFNFSCEGDASCTTSVDNGKADVTAHTGAKITINRLVIQVTSLAGGSAILRLSPA